MRTTLTIDDDIAGLLKRRARELDQPFKQVVNSALRRGLSEGIPTIEVPEIVVRPHDFGMINAEFNMDRLNQLVDELETEDFLQSADRS